jgi:hypothetical protein
MNLREYIIDFFKDKNTVFVDKLCSDGFKINDYLINYKKS